MNGTPPPSGADSCGLPDFILICSCSSGPPLLPAAGIMPSWERGGRQYIQLATLIAIERMDDFPSEDCATIFNSVPVEALPDALHWLENTIERMEEDHRAACVLDRVIPFFHDCWPKDRRHMTPKISEGLASLCLVSPTAFPAIWEACRYNIGRVSQLHAILSKLQQSGICRSSPREALDFLVW